MGKRVSVLLAFLLFLHYAAGSISRCEGVKGQRIAGDGVSSLQGDFHEATGARFGYVSGISVGKDGSVYVADAIYSRIRVIKDNVIFPFAGTGSSSLTKNQTSCNGTGCDLGAIGQILAVDNLLYLVHSNDAFAAIRTLDLKTKNLATLVNNNLIPGLGADGSANSSAITKPFGIAVNQGKVYFTSQGDQFVFGGMVKLVSSGVISTLLGGNPTVGATSLFNFAAPSPKGVAVSPDGMTLYVTSYDNHQVYRIQLQTGLITVFAGTGERGFDGDGGAAVSAKLDSPGSITLNDDGSVLYIADTGNYRVRAVDTTSGVITTFAGSGLSAISAPSTAASRMSFIAITALAWNPVRQSLLVATPTTIEEVISSCSSDLQRGTSVVQCDSGAIFEYFPSYVSFREARTAAKGNSIGGSISGELAYWNNKVELECIRKLVSLVNEKVWVPVSDQNLEGRWVWNSGYFTNALFYRTSGVDGCDDQFGGCCEMDPSGNSCDWVAKVPSRNLRQNAAVLNTLGVLEDVSEAAKFGYIVRYDEPTLCGNAYFAVVYGEYSSQQAEDDANLRTFKGLQGNLAYFESLQDFECVMGLIPENEQFWVNGYRVGTTFVHQSGPLIGQEVNCGEKSDGCPIATGELNNQGSVENQLALIRRKSAADSGLADLDGVSLRRGYIIRYNKFIDCPFNSYSVDYFATTGDYSAAQTEASIHNTKPDQELPFFLGFPIQDADVQCLIKNLPRNIDIWTGATNNANSWNFQNTDFFYPLGPNCDKPEGCCLLDQCLWGDAQPSGLGNQAISISVDDYGSLTWKSVAKTQTLNAYLVQKPVAQKCGSAQFALLPSQGSRLSALQSLTSQGYAGYRVSLATFNNEDEFQCASAILPTHAYAWVDVYGDVSSNTFVYGSGSPYFSAAVAMSCTNQNPSEPPCHWVSAAPAVITNEQVLLYKGDTIGFVTTSDPVFQAPVLVRIEKNPVVDCKTAFFKVYGEDSHVYPSQAKKIARSSFYQGIPGSFAVLRTPAELRCLGQMLPVGTYLLSGSDLESEGVWQFEQNDGNTAFYSSAGKSGCTDAEGCCLVTNLCSWAQNHPKQGNDQLALRKTLEDTIELVSVPATEQLPFLIRYDAHDGAPVLKNVIDATTVKFEVVMREQTSLKEAAELASTHLLNGIKGVLAHPTSEQELLALKDAIPPGSKLFLDGISSSLNEMLELELKGRRIGGATMTDNKEIAGALVKLLNVQGLAVSGDFSELYIADTDASVVWKMTVATKLVQRFVGMPGSRVHTGDGGPASDATLCGPLSVVMDSANTVLYISSDCEESGSSIRKVDLTTNEISSLTQLGRGSCNDWKSPFPDASTCSVNRVTHMVVTNDGSLFFSDANNYRIRKINPASKMEHVAGSGTPGDFGDGGPARLASFVEPAGLLYVESSSTLYIADKGAARIRSISLAQPVPMIQPVYPTTSSTEKNGFNSNRRIVDCGDVVFELADVPTPYNDWFWARKIAMSSNYQGIGGSLAYWRQGSNDYNCLNNYIGTVATEFMNRWIVIDGKVTTDPSGKAPNSWVKYTTGPLAGSIMYIPLTTTTGVCRNSACDISGYPASSTSTEYGMYALRDNSGLRAYSQVSQVSSSMAVLIRYDKPVNCGDDGSLLSIARPDDWSLNEAVKFSKTLNYKGLTGELATDLTTAELQCLGTSYASHLNGIGAAYAYTGVQKNSDGSYSWIDSVDDQGNTKSRLFYVPNGVQGCTNANGCYLSSSGVFLATPPTNPYVLFWFQASGSSRLFDRPTNSEFCNPSYYPCPQISNNDQGLPFVIRYKPRVDPISNPYTVTKCGNTLFEVFPLKGWYNQQNSKYLTIQHAVGTMFRAPYADSIGLRATPAYYKTSEERDCMRRAITTHMQQTTTGSFSYSMGIYREDVTITSCNDNDRPGKWLVEGGSTWYDPSSQKCYAEDCAWTGGEYYLYFNDRALGYPYDGTTNPSPGSCYNSVEYAVVRYELPIHCGDDNSILYPLANPAGLYSFLSNTFDVNIPFRGFTGTIATQVTQSELQCLKDKYKFLGNTRLAVGAYQHANGGYYWATTKTEYTNQDTSHPFYFPSGSGSPACSNANGCCTSPYDCTWQAGSPRATYNSPNQVELFVNDAGTVAWKDSQASAPGLLIRFSSSISKPTSLALDSSNNLLIISSREKLTIFDLTQQIISSTSTIDSASLILGPDANGCYYVSGQKHVNQICNTLSSSDPLLDSENSPTQTEFPDAKSNPTKLPTPRTWITDENRRFIDCGSVVYELVIKNMDFTSAYNTAANASYAGAPGYLAFWSTLSEYDCLTVGFNLLMNQDQCANSGLAFWINGKTNIGNSNIYGVQGPFNGIYFGNAQTNGNGGCRGNDASLCYLCWGDPFSSSYENGLLFYDYTCGSCNQATSRNGAVNWLRSTTSTYSGLIIRYDVPSKGRTVTQWGPSLGLECGSTGSILGVYSNPAISTLQDAVKWGKTTTYMGWEGELARDITVTERDCVLQRYVLPGMYVSVAAMRKSDTSWMWIKDEAEIANQSGQVFWRPGTGCIAGMACPGAGGGSSPHGFLYQYSSGSFYNVFTGFTDYVVNGYYPNYLIRFKPRSIPPLPFPYASATASDGSGQYVADPQNHVVRFYDLTSNQWSVFAGTGVAGHSGNGGLALQANLCGPNGLLLDEQFLWISCSCYHYGKDFMDSVRRIELASLKIFDVTSVGRGDSCKYNDSTPIAAINCTVNGPMQLTKGPNGSIIFADSGNHRVRLISASLQISKLAGTSEEGTSGDNGPASSAKFYYPAGVATSGDLSSLFISDFAANTIRKVNLNTGVITAFAGSSKPVLPFLEWDFRVQFQDLGHRNNLNLKGSSIYDESNGYLTLGNNGYAYTDSRMDIAIDEHTLEVVVQLNPATLADENPIISLQQEHIGVSLLLRKNATGQYWCYRYDGVSSITYTCSPISQTIVASEKMHIIVVATAIDFTFYRNGNIIGAPVARNSSFPLFRIGGGPIMYGRRDMTGSILWSVVWGRYTSSSQTGGVGVLQHTVGAQYFKSSVFIKALSQVEISGLYLYSQQPPFVGENVTPDLMRLSGPAGLAFNENGELLVADYFNNRVRVIDQNNIAKTLSGTGLGLVSYQKVVAKQYPLKNPGYLEAFSLYNCVYISCEESLEALCPAGDEFVLYQSSLKGVGIYSNVDHSCWIPNLCPWGANEPFVADSAIAISNNFDREVIYVGLDAVGPQQELADGYIVRYDNAVKCGDSYLFVASPPVDIRRAYDIASTTSYLGMQGSLAGDLTVDELDCLAASLPSGWSDVSGISPVLTSGRLTANSKWIWTASMEDRLNNHGETFYDTNGCVGAPSTCPWLGGSPTGGGNAAVIVVNPVDKSMGLVSRSESGLKGNVLVRFQKTPPIDCATAVFEVVQDPLYRNEALDAAKQRSYNGIQGGLASILSFAEFECLSKSLPVGSSLLLGGSRHPITKEWRWDDGPLEGTNFWRANGEEGCAEEEGCCFKPYACRWMPDEPNNVAGIENFLQLEMSPDGEIGWNDVSDELPQSYLVRYDKTPQFGRIGIVTVGGRTTFELYSGQFSYTEAQQFALSRTFQGRTGSLATFGAREEIDALVKILPEGVDAWVGLSDENEEGRWQFTNPPYTNIDFFVEEGFGVCATTGGCCILRDDLCLWNPDFPGSAFSGFDHATLSNKGLQKVNGRTYRASILIRYDSLIQCSTGTTFAYMAGLFSYDEAKQAAQEAVFLGVRGSLAVVSNIEEINCVAQIVPVEMDGWLAIESADGDGDWYYANGPASGRVFYDALGVNGCSNSDGCCGATDASVCDWLYTHPQLNNTNVAFYRGAYRYGLLSTVGTVRRGAVVRFESLVPCKDNAATFELIPEPVGYSSAKSIAASKAHISGAKGKIATFSTQSDLDCASRLISTSSSAWIGALDKFLTGEWLWQAPPNALLQMYYAKGAHQCNQVGGCCSPGISCPWIEPEGPSKNHRAVVLTKTRDSSQTHYQSVEVNSLHSTIVRYDLDPLPKVCAATGSAFAIIRGQFTFEEAVLASKQVHHRGLPGELASSLVDEELDCILDLLNDNEEVWLAGAPDKNNEWTWSTGGLSVEPFWVPQATHDCSSSACCLPEGCCAPWMNDCDWITPPYMYKKDQALTLYKDQFTAGLSRASTLSRRYIAVRLQDCGNSLPLPNVWSCDAANKKYQFIEKLGVTQKAAEQDAQNLGFVLANPADAVEFQCIQRVLSMQTSAWLSSVSFENKCLRDGSIQDCLSISGVNGYVVELPSATVVTNNAPAECDINQSAVANPSTTSSVIAGIGSGSFTGDGDNADASGLNGPEGLAIDKEGNLYVADVENNRIRLITPDGVISTIIGSGMATYSGDGLFSEFAEVNRPRGVFVANNGDLLIADSGNHRIRRISRESGIVTTVVGNGIPGYAGDGSVATEASLYFPTSVVEDSMGNLYISDTGNHRIRRVDVSSGIISTVAGNGDIGYLGDGPATISPLNYPRGLALLSDYQLLIANEGANRVMLLSLDTLRIITLIGNGMPGHSFDSLDQSLASINSPSGLAVDVAGRIFVACKGDNVVRVVDLEGKIWSWNTEQGGVSKGIAVDTDGSVFISDSNKHIVKRVVLDEWATSLNNEFLCGFNGRTYQFVPAPYMTWEDAQYEASKISPLGLATAFTPDEMLCISKIIPRNGKVWLAGKREDDSWKWVESGVDQVSYETEFFNDGKCLNNLCAFENPDKEPRSEAVFDRICARGLSGGYHSCSSVTPVVGFIVQKSPPNFISCAANGHTYEFVYNPGLSLADAKLQAQVRSPEFGMATGGNEERMKCIAEVMRYAVGTAYLSASSTNSGSTRTWHWDVPTLPNQFDPLFYTSGVGCDVQPCYWNPLPPLALDIDSSALTALCTFFDSQSNTIAYQACTPQQNLDVRGYVVEYLSDDTPLEDDPEYIEACKDYTYQFVEAPGINVETALRLAEEKNMRVAHVTSLAQAKCIQKMLPYKKYAMVGAFVSGSQIDPTGNNWFWSGEDVFFYSTLSPTECLAYTCLWKSGSVFDQTSFALFEGESGSLIPASSAAYHMAMEGLILEQIPQQVASIGEVKYSRLSVLIENVATGARYSNLPEAIDGNPESFQCVPLDDPLRMKIFWERGAVDKVVRLLFTAFTTGPNVVLDYTTQNGPRGRREIDSPFIQQDLFLDESYQEHDHLNVTFTNFNPSAQSNLFLCIAEVDITVPFEDKYADCPCLNDGSFGSYCALHFPGDDVPWCYVDKSCETMEFSDPLRKGAATQRSLKLCPATPPINSQFDQATTVVLDGISFCSTENSLELPPPLPAGVASGMSYETAGYGVWFRLLGSGGTVTLSTCSQYTYIGSYLSVYEARSDLEIYDSLAVIGQYTHDVCNSNDGKMATTVSFDSIKNVWYYVFVGGRLNAASGSFAWGSIAVDASGGFVAFEPPTSTEVIWPEYAEEYRISTGLCRVGYRLTPVDHEEQVCTAFGCGTKVTTITECVDYDECAEGLDNCSDLAECINTDGSFICKCPVTHVDENGDGTQCREKTEFEALSDERRQNSLGTLKTLDVMPPDFAEYQAQKLYLETKKQVATLQMEQDFGMQYARLQAELAQLEDIYKDTLILGPAPPNIGYIGRGYDFLEGNPANEGLDPGFRLPVLDLTAPTQYRTTADGLWYLPDNVDVTFEPANRFESTQELITNEQEYRKTVSSDVEWGVGVAVDYKGEFSKVKVGASASVAYSNSKSFQSTASQLANSETHFIEVVGRSRVYQARLTKAIPDNLSQELKYHISILNGSCFFESGSSTPQCSPSDMRLYLEFIDLFGTHYTKRVVLGGKAYERFYMSSSSIEALEESEQSSSDTLNIGVSGSFEGYGQTITAEAQYDRSAGNAVQSASRSKISSLAEKRIEWYIGGTPAVAPNDGSTDGLKEWAASVPENPVPIEYSLNPIIDLIIESNFPDDPQIKAKQLFLGQVMYDACIRVGGKYCSELQVEDINELPENAIRYGDFLYIDTANRNQGYFRRLGQDNTSPYEFKLYPLTDEFKPLSTPPTIATPLLSSDPKFTNVACKFTVVEEAFSGYETFVVVDEYTKNNWRVVNNVPTKDDDDDFNDRDDKGVNDRPDDPLVQVTVLTTDDKPQVSLLRTRISLNSAITTEKEETSKFLFDVLQRANVKTGPVDGGKPTGVKLCWITSEPNKYVHMKGDIIKFAKVKVLYKGESYEAQTGGSVLSDASNCISVTFSGPNIIDKDPITCDNIVSKRIIGVASPDICKILHCFPKIKSSGGEKCAAYNWHIITNTAGASIPVCDIYNGTYDGTFELNNKKIPLKVEFENSPVIVGSSEGSRVIALDKPGDMLLWSTLVSPFKMYNRAKAPIRYGSSINIRLLSGSGTYTNDQLRDIGNQQFMIAQPSLFVSDSVALRDSGNPFVTFRLLSKTKALGSVVTWDDEVLFEILDGPRYVVFDSMSVVMMSAATSSEWPSWLPILTESDLQKDSLSWKLRKVEGAHNIDRGSLGDALIKPVLHLSIEQPEVPYPNNMFVLVIFISPQAITTKSGKPPHLRNFNVQMYDETGVEIEKTIGLSNGLLSNPSLMEEAYDGEMDDNVFRLGLEFQKAVQVGYKIKVSPVDIQTDNEFRQHAEIAELVITKHETTSLIKFSVDVQRLSTNSQRFTVSLNVIFSEPILNKYARTPICGRDWNINVAGSELDTAGITRTYYNENDVANDQTIDEELLVDGAKRIEISFTQEIFIGWDIEFALVKPEKWVWKTDSATPIKFNSPYTVYVVQETD